MKGVPTSKKPASGSVRQKTYNDLKSLILSGGVRPAERISETRFAERLGVSRTPLREALSRLEEEGLVVKLPNIGYSIADIDLAAACDLLVVREALDVCAAELACSSATDDQLTEIEELVKQMAQLENSKNGSPSDAARNLELGLWIHKVIARATRNEALIRLTDQIYQQLQLALLLEVMWVDLGESGFKEHKAIANAICARDKKAAAKAARLHVRGSLENMKKVQDVLNLRRASPLQPAGR